VHPKCPMLPAKRMETRLMLNVCFDHGTPGLLATAPLAQMAVTRFNQYPTTDSICQHRRYCTAIYSRQTASHTCCASAGSGCARLAAAVGVLRARNTGCVVLCPASTPLRTRITCACSRSSSESLMKGHVALCALAQHRCLYLQ
jgi:hypothetical protein